MRVAIVCLASALALMAGCSKKPATSGAASGAPAAAAASEPASAEVKGPGGGAFMPHRKSGLWEMAIDTSGGPGVKMTAQMCVDASTDSDFTWHGPHSQSKDCEKAQMHPTLGGVTFDSTCRMGSRTMTTHGVVKGDFDKAYDVDLSTHIDPAPSGMPAEMKTTMKARWLGACPPGLKPGHMSMNMGGVRIGR